MGDRWTVEVEDRCTPQLGGRRDRDYAAPPQPRDAALALAALLLDVQGDLTGDGPWRRALPGGRRTVRLVPA